MAALVLVLAVLAAAPNVPFGMMRSETTTSFGTLSAPMRASGDGEEGRMMDSVDFLSVASSDATDAETAQKIIKTGSLSLVVDDVAQAASKATAIATGTGGFVQESDVSEREDGTHFGNVIVRVPSASFEAVMTEIKTLATAVETESVQGQDVTEQYTDLEAQLRNAKAQEEEYLKVLRLADTVEEILQVQSYLSSVRGTIESFEGRLQYLENRTSYSTIAIGLSEEFSVRIPTKDFRFGSTIREAGQALVAILQNLAVALVWIVILGGGILVPVAIVIWGIVKTVRVIRRR